MDAKLKKKSFVLFADFVTAVSVLTDEQAGKLFKLIFAYVNDMEISKSQDPASTVKRRNGRRNAGGTRNTPT